ncbi:MAG: hypothetical protein QXU18_10925 [Thermoplasmatales archaeon]
MEYWILGLSIAATLLSIISLSKSIIIPIIFRPNIEVTGGNEGEYLSHFQKSSDTTLGIIEEFYIYRLKVENKNCFSSITEPKIHSRMLTINKDDMNLVPFNPVLMRWASNSEFTERLSRDEHSYVNLLTIVYSYTLDNNERRKDVSYKFYPAHTGITNLALAGGFPMNELTEGSYLFRIGLHGDIMASLHYNVQVSFKNLIDAPEIEVTVM